MASSVLSTGDQPVTKTSSLVLVVLDGGEVPDLLAGLAKAPDIAGALSSGTAGTDVIALLAGAGDRITEALDGQSPYDIETVCTEWKTMCTTALTVLRQFTGQVTVLERGALAADLQGVSRALAMRWPDFVQVSKDQAAAAPDTVRRLLASAVIGSDPQLRALDDEIAARAFYAAPRPEVAETAQALSELMSELKSAETKIPSDQQATLEQLEAECARLSEERSLLTESVSQLQDALERGALDIRLRQAALEAAERRQATMQDTARRREALLGAALLEDSAAAHDLRSRIAQMEGEITALKKSRDVALGEADALRRSTSWKITGPIRALRRGMGPD